MITTSHTAMLIYSSLSTRCASLIHRSHYLRCLHFVAALRSKQLSTLRTTVVTTRRVLRSSIALGGVIPGADTKLSGTIAEIILRLPTSLKTRLRRRPVRRVDYRPYPRYLLLAWYSWHSYRRGPASSINIDTAIKTQGS